MMKKIWWNSSMYMEEVIFPIVNWEQIGYLNCAVGLIIPMKDLGNGKYAYYEVVRVYGTGGSDWIRPSDSKNCDLRFHSIRKGLGVGNLPERKGIRFID
jgi:hypothetical protein